MEIQSQEQRASGSLSSATTGRLEFTKGHCPKLGVSGNIVKLKPPNCKQDKYFCYEALSRKKRDLDEHGGNTKFPTCAVDRVGTV